MLYTTKYAAFCAVGTVIFYVLCLPYGASMVSGEIRAQRRTA